MTPKHSLHTALVVLFLLSGALHAQLAAAADSPTRIIQASDGTTPGRKNLLYTTVAGTGPYVRCLHWMVLSLNHHSATSASFELLVIVDKGSYAEVEGQLPRREHLAFRVDFLVLDPAEVDKRGDDFGVAASARKLDLHRYARIGEFKNIMFLDVDHLVTFDVSTLLDTPLTPGILYSHHESPLKTNYTDPSQHNKIWWSFGNYTQEQLEFFKQNKIYPLNAGCFMFLNTPEMVKELKDIKSSMMTFKGRYYYEQSFLNYYFNTRKRANTSLLAKYDLEFLYYQKAMGRYNLQNKLVHFIPIRGGTAKEGAMREFYHREVLLHQQRQVAGVQATLQFLSAFLGQGQGIKWHIGQIPRKLLRYFQLAASPRVETICSVGIGAGHTAAVLLTGKPYATYYAFDPMSSNVSKVVVRLFQQVYGSSFHFVKGSSADTLPWLHSTYPDVQCDLLAIESVTTYEARITDIINGIKLMRPGATLVVDNSGNNMTKAYEDIVAAGYLTQTQCEQPAQYDVGKTTGVKWCWGTVATGGVQQPIPVPLLAQHAAFQLDVDD